jgi:hypothetical protein
MSPVNRKTDRTVGGLMIDVHERTLDVRQDLYFVLQLLADIVRLPQRGVPVHDDVNFNKVVRSALYTRSALVKR